MLRAVAVLRVVAEAQARRSALLRAALPWLLGPAPRWPAPDHGLVEAAGAFRLAPDHGPLWGRRVAWPPPRAAPGQGRLRVPLIRMRVSRFLARGWPGPAA
jgi:hypothetical protein